MTSVIQSSKRTVSVIIPVRNREQDIEFAIRSALNQSASVQEIIVVNDGSTDDTKHTLDKLAESIAILRPIHLPASGGAANARNIGVNLAKADWIAFLDSDDAWLPDKLERQFEIITTSTDLIGVFTGIRYVPRVNGVLNPSYDYIPDVPIDLNSLRRLNYLSSTSTALVRRNAFLKVGGFDSQLPSCQDWDLWLRLAELGNLHLIRIPLTLCSYANTDRISRNAAAVFEGHNAVFTRIYQSDTRPTQRRLNKAYHRARLAQIWLNDLGNPVRAVLQATSAILTFPTRLSVKIFGQAIIGILRGK